MPPEKQLSRDSHLAQQTRSTAISLDCQTITRTRQGNDEARHKPTPGVHTYLLPTNEYRCAPGTINEHHATEELNGNTHGTKQTMQQKFTSPSTEQQKAVQYCACTVDTTPACLVVLILCLPPQRPMHTCLPIVCIPTAYAAINSKRLLWPQHMTSRQADSLQDKPTIHSPPLL